MQGIQAKISPAFQLAHLECHSAAKPDLKTDWTSLGLRRDLLEALNEGFKLKQPLPTQIQGLEPVMRNRKILFAAQTGSGKTLTYLLPLFQKLKSEEDALLGQQGKNVNRMEAIASIRAPASPRAIILLPTRELVKQVYKVAKGLSHYCKLKVEICDDLVTKDDYVDILIATPKSLSKLFERKGKLPHTFSFFTNFLVLKSGKIKHFVVDEADTLLTGNFLEETKAVLDAQPSANIVATSATITKSLQRALKANYPDVIVNGILLHILKLLFCS